MCSPKTVGSCRVKGTTDIVSGLVQVKRVEGESQIVSRVQKILRGMRLKSNVSRRLTIDVEVDIQTGETYMLFESYICAKESQGLNKRNKY